jgi:hypothetical protein
MDNNSKTSYQIVPGTFYGEACTWIYESHDGAFQRHWGPYWSPESAQAQIKAWTNWTK